MSLPQPDNASPKPDTSEKPQTTSRRTFLKAALGATASALFGSRNASASTSGNTPGNENAGIDPSNSGLKTSEGKGDLAWDYGKGEGSGVPVADSTDQVNRNKMTFPQSPAATPGAEDDPAWNYGEGGESGIPVVDSTDRSKMTFPKSETSAAAKGDPAWDYGKGEGSGVPVVDPNDSADRSKMTTPSSDSPKSN